MIKYSKSNIINGYILNYMEIIPEVDHREMQDEAGRPILVTLKHDDQFDINYDRITLFILYLDDNTYRIYNPHMFLNRDAFANSEYSFDYLYEKCKEEEYEEGKLNTEVR